MGTRRELSSATFSVTLHLSRVTAIVTDVTAAGGGADVVGACATRVAMLNKSEPAAVPAVVAADETHTAATFMTAIVTACMTGCIIGCVIATVTACMTGCITVSLAGWLPL